MAPSIPYGRQFITQEDVQAVLEVLGSDFLTQGPAVENFEKAFAKYVGARHAIAVTNGTAALHLSAIAMGVNAQSRVLCPSTSFVASANCVRYCGGQVEFIDISNENYCVDLNQLEQKLMREPGQYSGLVAVDLAGYPVVRKELKELCDRHQLWIIEDACHAFGAEVKTDQGWKKSGCGDFSALSIFSFHPVKHITTGEGGLITTNDDRLAAHLRRLRTHGITKDPKEMSEVDGPWDMEMLELGYNYRISDILCALGLSQLKRADENLRRRREIAQMYTQALQNSSLKMPKTEDYLRHGYHLYVARHPKRNVIFEKLREHHIYSQVHYIPIHQQPYYKRIKTFSLPVAEKYYAEAFSLPMYHSITNAEVDRVISTLQKILKEIE